MTTTTYTVSRYNAAELRQIVNDLAAQAKSQGQQVLVNGREVHSLWPGDPAFSWQNGTVSVRVRGRKPGKQGDVYIKVGQTLTLTTPDDLEPEDRW